MGTDLGPKYLLYFKNGTPCTFKPLLKEYTTTKCGYRVSAHQHHNTTVSTTNAQNNKYIGMLATGEKNQ